MEYDFFQSCLNGHAILSSPRIEGRQDRLGTDYIYDIEIYTTLCGLDVEHNRCEDIKSERITCPKCDKLLSHQYKAEKVNAFLLNGEIVFIRREDMFYPSDLAFNKLTYKNGNLILVYFDKNGDQIDSDCQETNDCLDYLQFMRIEKFGLDLLLRK
jgi:hypothetical protein